MASPKAKNVAPPNDAPAHLRCDPPRGCGHTFTREELKKAEKVLFGVNPGWKAKCSNCKRVVAARDLR